MTENPDAYICYNRADADWVHRLATQLESETIDGNSASRHLKVFFDEWDIAPGDSLIDRMNEGMKKARHVLTVMSPEFIGADWPRFEWKHIVAQDPNNTQGRLIPLMLRDMSLDGTERIDLCAPFRDLKYIDFRKASEFRRGFSELVRKIRNSPHERGRRLPPLVSTSSVILPAPSSGEAAWLPDAVPEFLFSNLLAVSGVPSHVWHGVTPFRKKEEVWAAVPDASPFILREERLYTFTDLQRETEPLRAAVSTESISRVSRNEWVLHPDKQKWWMALLNSNLSAFLRRKWIRADGKGRFYFAPNNTGDTRVFPSPSGRGRTVAKHIASDDGAGFWVHHGARLKFRKFDERMFLSVEPLYLFTEDGRVSISGVSAGKLSQMWMGKQRNDAIFRDVLFWAFVLGGGQSEARIETGGLPMRILTLPATAKTSYGIGWDSVQIRTLFQHQDDELDDVAKQVTEVEEDDDEEEEEPQ